MALASVRIAAAKIISSVMPRPPNNRIGQRTDVSHWRLPFSVNAGTGLPFAIAVLALCIGVCALADAIIRVAA